MEVQCEEMELRLQFLRKGQGEAVQRDKAELKALQEKRAELRELIGGVSAPQAEEPKEEVKDAKEEAEPTKKSKKAAAETEEPPSREPSPIAKCLKGPIFKGIMRTFGGVMAISLYFADLISDIQVLMLFWQSGNYVYSWISILLLVGQFFVVYIRVIPYLSSTFGSDSELYFYFLWFGFPWGLVALDFLMFLEPFGLLSVIPFPEWLRQFVPAYKATRIIAEVAIESFPQCVLQAYVYYIVIEHTKRGIATPEETELYEFADALPKSILISILAMLKTWIELVSAARQAGLSVGAKAVQLWQVGAGLPLDAIKKGAILEFTCSYTLEDVEIMPLLDALSKNASIIHLDLSVSGIIWNGPKATGAPLIEAIHHGPAALSELETFKITESNDYVIPIQTLRLEGMVH